MVRGSRDQEFEAADLTSSSELVRSGVQPRITSHVPRLDRGVLGHRASCALTHAPYGRQSGAACSVLRNRLALAGSDRQLKTTWCRIEDCEPESKEGLFRMPAAEGAMQDRELPFHGCTASAATKLTVEPGGQGTDAITIAPQNGPFPNAIQLSCSISGPSPMPTCSLSHSSVTPKSATSTLTINAPTPAQVVRSMGGDLKMLRKPLLLLLSGVVLFGLGPILIVTSKRKRVPGLIFGLVCLEILVQIACAAGAVRYPNPCPTRSRLRVCQVGFSI
jgi:hypothetical protein